MTPKAVFDCVVYVQAAGKPLGPSAACLAAAIAGTVELFATADVIAEVEDVLNRPRFRAQFPHLTDAAVATFLTTVRAVAVIVVNPPAVATLARDPKDEKYLNLAAAASATHLLTWDNDLLDLMTGTDPDATAFRTNHPGIAILTPAAFLAVIRPTP